MFLNFRCIINMEFILCTMQGQGQDFISLQGYSICSNIYFPHFSLINYALLYACIYFWVLLSLIHWFISISLWKYRTENLRLYSNPYLLPSVEGVQARVGHQGFFLELGNVHSVPSISLLLPLLPLATELCLQQQKLYRQIWKPVSIGCTNLKNPEVYLKALVCTT